LASGAEDDLDHQDQVWSVEAIFVHRQTGNRKRIERLQKKAKNRGRTLG